LQGFVPAQFTHALPAAPQAPIAVPAGQFGPLVQPVQQLPLRHLPLVQFVPDFGV
jgi:hypothetical protein